MAQHLAPDKKKKLQNPKARRQALPRVLNYRFGQNKKQYYRELSWRTTIPVLLALLLWAVGFLLRSPVWVKALLLGASALASGYELLRRALKRIVERRLPEEELLFVVAAVVIFSVGDFAASAFCLLALRVGELVQAYVLTRTDRGVDLLRSIMPEKAHLVVGEVVSEIVPETVNVGDTLRVEVGERIPVDGVVLEGMSAIDCAALCGEGEIVNVSAGGKLRAGCINLSAPLTMRAERLFSDSAAAKRLESFEQARAMDSKLEKRMRRYAGIYTPTVALCALLLGLIAPIFFGSWTEWLRRAALFLLLCSPSALLVSVPLCFEGALLSAEMEGIRVFGKGVIERLARVRTMVFGKTGVITDGRFQVSDAFPDGVNEEELLTLAAAAESRSLSPMAEALREAAGWKPEDADGVMEIEEIPGRGVSAFIEGRHVYVGSAALMEAHDVFYRTPNRAGSAIHVAVENRYWGHIIMNDKVREGAFDALEDLRAQGVTQMVMLTGDVLSVSNNVANALGIDTMRSELSLEAKLSALRYFREALGERATLAYVGDGLYDAPLFNEAQVGISLDTLRHDDGVDKADVAVMSGDIRRLPSLQRMVKAAWSALWQNILFCCGMKLLLLVLALCGVLPLALGAAADALCMSLTALNVLHTYTIR